jgi:hypothetical protein
MGSKADGVGKDLWFIYTSIHKQIHKLITSSSRAGTDLILIPTDASQ